MSAATAPRLAAPVQDAAYQSPATPAASTAGATTPFTTYQAPQGTLGGGASVVSLTAAPTSQYDSPQGEAAGHAYVQLTGTGQYVQWTNNTGQQINFINVRAAIPDSPSGGGITATLDLYVNGVFRQALNMNSMQSWQYEGNGNYTGSNQNPANGDPRDFWDEFHAFISGSPIPAGATFSLQKDSSNTASFYWINSIDLWSSSSLRQRHDHRQQRERGELRPHRVRQRLQRFLGNAQQQQLAERHPGRPLWRFSRRGAGYRAGG